MRKYGKDGRLDCVICNRCGKKLAVKHGIVREGVFTNRGRVVASVCTHPASTGYYLSFTGGENTYYSYSDGGYSHIEYGDEIVFEVMQDDGFVRLYARVEE